jgi:hypothetical protein
MPIRGEKWLIERADRMHNAIVNAIVRFEQRYTRPTPRDVAWARHVTERMHAWTEHLYGPTNARRPRQRIDAPVLLDSDEIESARVELEATKQELTSEQLDEKRARWRRMWARIHGIIANFMRIQRDCFGDDRELADSIVDQIRLIAARQYIDLESRHPGLPPIDDIDAGEMLFGLLLDDDDDDDDDDSDQLLDSDNAADNERSPS